MIASYATLLVLQAPPATPRGGGGWLLGLQIVLILGIFYFMMIRPQQKQRRKHESMQLGLKKGDEIMTVGGILGRVVHIKETMKEGTPAPALSDPVTIQSGDTRLIVERGRIARIGTVDTAAPGA
jgi:preprotein translocase subunit YajC